MSDPSRYIFAFIIHQQLSLGINQLLKRVDVDQQTERKKQTGSEERSSHLGNLFCCNTNRTVFFPNNHSIALDVFQRAAYVEIYSCTRSAGPSRARVPEAVATRAGTPRNLITHHSLLNT
ncbi:hypothetical protein EVAR_19508_1 [Eumeta japonica]|uniref:Uncharacterized protein n=1 Tax=Eumeta variegata TaxID=151549 RepID=A0A4C1VAG2_EUMVA|nr:hypothetical protein EVAR_19508_1 [Eumeta japonica]